MYYAVRSPPPSSDSSSLPDLLSSLRQLVDWKSLGLELGLFHSTLQVIEDEQRGRVRRCIMEMVSEWLKQRDNVRKRGTSSWRRLVNALRRVGEDRIAEEVVRTAPWNKHR